MKVARHSPTVPLCGFLIQFYNIKNPYQIYRHFYELPKDKAKWLAVLLRILEVLGSNLDQRDRLLWQVFCDFPQSIQENAEIIPLIRPRPLSPNPLVSNYRIIRRFIV